MKFLATGGRLFCYKQGSRFLCVADICFKNLVVVNGKMGKWFGALQLQLLQLILGYLGAVIDVFKLKNLEK